MVTKISLVSLARRGEKTRVRSEEKWRWYPIASSNFLSTFPFPKRRKKLVLFFFNREAEEKGIWGIFGEVSSRRDKYQIDIPTRVERLCCLTSSSVRKFMQRGGRTSGWRAVDTYIGEQDGVFPWEFSNEAAIQRIHVPSTALETFPLSLRPLPLLRSLPPPPPPRPSLFHHRFCFSSFRSFSFPPPLSSSSSTDVVRGSDVFGNVCQSSSRFANFSPYTRTHDRENLISRTLARKYHRWISCRALAGKSIASLIRSGLQRRDGTFILKRKREKKRKKEGKSQNVVAHAFSFV